MVVMPITKKEKILIIMIVPCTWLRIVNCQKDLKFSDLILLPNNLFKKLKRTVITKKEQNKYANNVIDSIKKSSRRAITITLSSLALYQSSSYPFLFTILNSLYVKEAGSIVVGKG